MKVSHASVQRFVERHCPLFVRILETDNPPGEEAALRSLVEMELKGIGARTHVDKAGNLIGFLGDGKNAVLLGGHLDSVMPCKDVTVVRDGTVIKSDGRTNLCADDGAGIFEILTALKFVRRHKLPCPPVDILFTVGEEIGGKGVRGLDAARLRARHGLLIDHADSPGVVVIEAPCKRNFRVVCHGNAAHAIEAEHGINAIHMAARCIEKFPQGKLSKTLSANIGKIRGGEAVNQVPELVVFEGEVRSFSPLEAEDLLATYGRIIRSVEREFRRSGCAMPRVELTYTERREGYRHDNDLELLKVLSGVHKSIGIRTRLQSSMACSDAGDLTNKRITTLNCGSGAHRVHTKQEWVDMNDVSVVTWILVTFLGQLVEAERTR